MQIPLDEIVVKQRVRINAGDLEPLMTSMEQYGLMHPVTVNREKVLVAGYRRLEAARRLGWSTIRVHMIDSRDAAAMLEMEIDENRVRKDFTARELDEAYRRLEKLRRPPWWRRIWQAILDWWARLRGHRVK